MGLTATRERGLDCVTGKFLLRIRRRGWLRSLKEGSEVDGTEFCLQDFDRAFIKRSGGKTS